MSDILPSLGLIVAFSTLGLLITKILRPNCSVATLLASSYPMGSGVLTFAMFLLSWIGMRLDLWRMVSIYLVITVLVLVVFIYMRESNPGLGSSTNTSKRWVSGSLKIWLPGVILLVLMIAAAYFAVLRSYSSWDAAGIWGVKGLAIAMEGDVRAAREWGSHGLRYPLNIPLQISIFTVVGNSSIEHSKLIFPVYYGSLIVTVYAFLSLRAAWLKSLAGSLLVASVPIIFEHGTIAYANLPFTTYILLGCLSLLSAKRSSSRFEETTGGVFFGLAAWSRPEGFLIVASSLLVLGFSHWLLKGQKIITSNAILPFLFVSLVWQVFSFSMSSSSLPSDTLVQAIQGWGGFDLNLDAIYWTFRYAVGSLADPMVWGGLGYAALLLFVFNLGKISKAEHEIALNLTAIAAGIGFSVFVYYYLVSYSQDVQYLLGTSVDRIFMPVWILGFVAGFLLWSPDRPIR